MSARRSSLGEWRRAATPDGILAANGHALLRELGGVPISTSRTPLGNPSLVAGANSGESACPAPDTLDAASADLVHQSHASCPSAPSTIQRRRSWEGGPLAAAPWSAGADPDRQIGGVAARGGVRPRRCSYAPEV